MSIVILSAEGDQSTYNVIDWINYYNERVYLFSTKESVSLNAIEISENNRISFFYNGEKIDLEQINSFWHRRGNLSIQFPQLSFSEDFPFKKEFTDHLYSEQRKLKDYLNLQLKQRRHLGNIFQTNINKLIVLKKAQELNISIPSTLITNYKQELLNFRSKYQDVISKPISEAFSAHEINIGAVSMYTNVITNKEIDRLGDTFTTTLFQEKIEKKYELRIFFIENEFYAMAIFSQEDKKTSVDFRRYNFAKPNRTVPYNLPEALKIKLNLLMKEFNLNTGSIDMAVTLKNEYVFFEVNPIGQYGMTSYPCNYHLDKRIAEFLVKKNDIEI